MDFSRGLAYPFRGLGILRRDPSLVRYWALPIVITMSALLAFTLTGEDSVAFSGKVVQVAAVPLPGAMWLFGSSLIGLSGALRRKLSLA